MWWFLKSLWQLHFNKYLYSKWEKRGDILLIKSLLPLKLNESSSSSMSSSFMIPSLSKSSSSSKSWLKSSLESNIFFDVPILVDVVDIVVVNGAEMVSNFDVVNVEELLPSSPSLSLSSSSLPSVINFANESVVKGDTVVILLLLRLCWLFPGALLEYLNDFDAEVSRRPELQN